MRIWFTLNISAVIAEADVSWNGLFIGIWTTLEVSLVFVVACTLCLPKLIQAKGRKFRMALSYASAPFSAIPGIVRRKTGSQQGVEPSASQNTPRTRRTSTWEDIDLDDKGPKYFEEHEHTHWQEEISSRPRQPSRTSNRTSSAAGSSDYSQRHGSRQSGWRQDGFRLQPLHTPDLSNQQQQWKSAFSP
jgi:hypothetical protein